MRTIRTKVYQFSELSDEAKQNAISGLWDLNVDYDWWAFTYEDAENAGLIINGFDIDRQTIDIEFSEDAILTSSRILRDHGNTCDTYKVSVNFVNERDLIVNEWPRDGFGELNDVEGLDEALDCVESEYLKMIGGCYLSILAGEYEWRISDKTVSETIEANNYEFTEDGAPFWG